MENGQQSIRRLHFHLPFAIYHLPLLLLLSLSSCNVLGLGAAALPPATIRPRYTGLAGQSVAVLVWTERGIRIDWPTLPLDAGNAIQSKLQQAKTREVEKTTFPYSAASVLRYQQDHPDVDAQGINELATHLGVSRVIYVEVDGFSTRAEASLELYRGSMSGTLKVLEITNGQAKVAYEESNIRAVFPPKSPDEGRPDGNDYRYYLGTIDQFTTQVVNRLVSHSEEE
jgi:hypothetical protein